MWVGPRAYGNISAYDRTGADSGVNAANGYFSTPDG